MVEDGVSSMELLKGIKNACFIFPSLLWSLFTLYRCLLRCSNLKAASDESAKR